MTGRDSKASGGRARVKRWVTWVLSCTVLLAPALLWAAAGDLDTTFGAGGKVTTDFAGSGDEANALVRQSDGKLVAAGGAVTGGPDNFALVRYNADGSLDTTFGVGGKVTTDFAHDADEAVAPVQQSDEKLVAAGSAFTGNFYDFALVRYNANGSLDTTFGTGGKVTTAFGGSAHAFALVQQSDGKLVAAGGAFTGSSSDFALVRYNTNGTLDTTFGTRGKVTTDFAGDFDEAFALVQQSDGKLVAAGSAFTGSSDDFALARYSANGSLDTTFGTGGKVTTNFAGFDDVAFGLVQRSDGKLVAAGSASTASSQDFALVRYDASGSLDTTFGSGGKVMTGFAGPAQAFALVLQSDGNLVAAGSAFIGSSLDFALARYRGGGGGCN